ncbi:hypothetical protein IE53DRAFT_362263 [Violaceomyces palustris]|uniref:Uncharacterized protein n=1 Tax=Violaceomyces palustris TaxID=1673888 RepID=A0ACD0NXV1_9BASI|nr:hypothetical protein IE53DRAFT_362263 [Violaceomyces palustris]
MSSLQSGDGRVAAISEQISQARSLRRKQSKLGAHQSNSHGGSGSGAGLWLSKGSSPNQSFTEEPEMQEEAGGVAIGDAESPHPILMTQPKTYHFPASLASGPMLGLEGLHPQRVTTSASSKSFISSDIDLDLSFDFVSSLEAKRPAPRPPSTPELAPEVHEPVQPILAQERTSEDESPILSSTPPKRSDMALSKVSPSPRGMSSAQWRSRKAPPAPLFLKNFSALQPGLATSENQGPSIFSPDTPLVTTPLSATRRGASMRPSSHLKNSSSSSSNGSVLRLSASSPRLPPPFPPPTDPLPTPGQEDKPFFSGNSTPTSSVSDHRPTKRISHVPNKSQHSFASRKTSDSRTGTIRTSMESFRTADSGVMDESLMEILADEENLKASETGAGNAIGLLLVADGGLRSDQPQVFEFSPSPTSSATFPTSVPGPASGTDSLSPQMAYAYESSPSQSHSSPHTPFSPLFSDPGTARTVESNATTYTEWGQGVNAMHSAGTDGRLSKIHENGTKPPAFSSKQTVPFGSDTMAADGQGAETFVKGRQQLTRERNQAEPVSRTASRPPLSETAEWIMAQRLERQARQRKAGASISSSSNSEERTDAEDEGTKTMIISTSTSSSSEADFEPGHSSRDTNEIEKAMSQLKRGSDGSTGPWPQSPLLLSPTLAECPIPPAPLEQIAASHFPSSARRVSEPRVLSAPAAEFDGALENKAAKLQRASQTGGETSAASQAQARFGLGLDLGVKLGSDNLVAGSGGLRKARSEMMLRPRASFSDQDHTTIEMDATNVETTIVNRVQEVPLHRGSSIVHGPGPGLGLDLEHGPEAKAERSLIEPEARIERTTMKHLDVSSAQGPGPLPASHSQTSSIDGFACNVTPAPMVVFHDQDFPSEAGPSGSFQVLSRRSRVPADVPVTISGDLDGMVDIYSIDAESKTKHQGSGSDLHRRTRWSSKIWSVASGGAFGLRGGSGSHQDSPARANTFTVRDRSRSRDRGPNAPPMRTLTLVSKRTRTETGGGNPAEDPTGSEPTSQGGLERLDGTVSAPATAHIASTSTFRSSPLNPSSEWSAAPPASAQMAEQASTSKTTKRQRRTSRIGYITSGNNADIRLDMGTHSRSNSVTDKEAQSSGSNNIFESIKSPRVAPSPSGFTPRLHFDSSSAWGLPAQAAIDREAELGAKEVLLPASTAVSSHHRNTALSMDTVGLGLGLEVDELQKSRDRLRLLTSQTMPGATLPHQYLSGEGNAMLRRRSMMNPTTNPALRAQGHRSSASVQPTATIFPSAWASGNKRSSMGSAAERMGHKRSARTRFAGDDGRVITDEDSDEGPHEPMSRPMSIFVPTSSIQAHLLRTAGIETYQSLAASKRRSTGGNLRPPLFGAPSNVLESATPSRSLFYAGFLGMPWLWLIGGWWLDENGEILSGSGTGSGEKVEFWQHEASLNRGGRSETATVDENMARTPSPADSTGTCIDYGPEATFGTSSPTTSTRPGSGLVHSYSVNTANGKTIRTAPSHATLASAYSQRTALSNVASSPETIPQTRAKSLASILDPQPEVALFQSPVRVVESPSLSSSVGNTASISQHSSNLRQLASMGILLEDERHCDLPRIRSRSNSSSLATPGASWTETLAPSPELDVSSPSNVTPLLASQCSSTRTIASSDLPPHLRRRPRGSGEWSTCQQAAVTPKSGRLTMTSMLQRWGKLESRRRFEQGEEEGSSDEAKLTNCAMPGPSQGLETIKALFRNLMGSSQGQGSSPTSSSARKGLFSTSTTSTAILSTLGLVLTNTSLSSLLSSTTRPQPDRHRSLTEAPGTNVVVNPDDRNGNQQHQTYMNLLMLESILRSSIKALVLFKMVRELGRA